MVARARYEGRRPLHLRAGRLKLPRLHIVTDDRVLGDPGFMRTARSLLEVGGDRIALHIRGPGIGGRALWQLADSCVAIAQAGGGLVFVNDRIDVVLACGAAGVQIGRRSFPIGTARRILGPDLMIGASVHDPDGARSAAAEGADFLLAGTIYRSATHPEQAGSGPDWLLAVDRTGPPVIGIGGIVPERVADLLSAGSYGVAVIRGIWQASSPVAALREYLDRLG